MQPIDLKTIDRLNKAEGTPKISILLNMHTKGKEVRQNPIRLKNSLQRAKEQLPQSYLDNAELMKNLEAVSDLEFNSTFWEPRYPGLAIYIDGDSMQPFGAESSFTDLVYINNNFFTRPLYENLDYRNNYYLLDFSADHTKLYRLTRYGHERLDIKDMPESLEAITGLKEVTKSIQHKTIRPGGNSEYHGHGEGQDELDKYFTQYVQLIVSALTHHFATSNEVRLVVSGSSENISAFKHLAAGNFAVIGEINGDHEALAEEKLAGRARALVEQFRSDNIAKDLERTQELYGYGKASFDLAEILIRAHMGQIDTLLIASDKQVYGTVNLDDNSVTIGSEERERFEEEELLNLAAKYTVDTGGLVKVFDQEQQDTDKYIAAIFRY